jgi:hypothetical protein
MFDLHMPCSAHAVPMLRPCHATNMPFSKRFLKGTAQRGMGLARHV